jgi:hypothetical protein
MSVIAKFSCSHITDFGNSKEVNLQPVINGSEENKSFSLYTPSGSIKLNITNPDAFSQFEVGKEYLITFEEVVQQ